jgi:HD-GYP domain-containing protein (c-di-GMP phosphodiesterase class II)
MPTNVLRKWLKSFNTFKIPSYLILAIFLSVSTILTGCGKDDTAQTSTNATTTTEEKPPASSSQSSSATKEETSDSPEEETSDSPEEETSNADDSLDEEFLTNLNNLLDKVNDEKLNALAEKITEDEAIDDALTFCQALDDGKEIDEVIQVVQQEADNAKLSGDDQETLGGYLALIMIGATDSYCTEHKERVEAYFSN